MDPVTFRAARRKLGLSTNALGRILDTDPRTIRRWEDPAHDRTPNPIACRVLEWLQAGFRPPEYPKNLRQAGDAFIKDDDLDG